MSYAKLVPVGYDLAFTSSFDRGLVDEFKRQIPPDGRRWDPGNKRWLVAPAYAKTCADLAHTYLGVDITVPTLAAPVNEINLWKLDYIGRCKARDDGSSSAFGWADGAWKLAFPETVLRDYFAAEPARPNEQPTLYAVLAVKPGAKYEDMRSNYRRLVKQWHPDVCHENNAAEVFKTIQHAYEVLQDDAKRKKYDAGLAFAAQQRQAEKLTGTPVQDQYGYRSPFRCGYVLVEGRASIGRFVVEKILEWRDIVNAAGLVMTVSWPMGAKEFEISWT